MKERHRNRLSLEAYKNVLDRELFLEEVIAPYEKLVSTALKYDHLVYNLFALSLEQLTLSPKGGKVMIVPVEQPSTKLFPNAGLISNFTWHLQHERKIYIPEEIRYQSKKISPIMHIVYEEQPREQMESFKVILNTNSGFRFSPQIMPSVIDTLRDFSGLDVTYEEQSIDPYLVDYYGKKVSKTS